MVPVLGTEDIVGAPKYGLWKSYIYKKKNTTIWIISQAYLKKFYTGIHFTGSWFLTTSLIEVEAVPSYTTNSPQFKPIFLFSHR
jgi:hypothetical protein